MPAHFTPQARAAQVARLAEQRGEQSPHWKGDDVAYSTVHSRLARHRPKTGECQDCGNLGKTDYSYCEGEGYSTDLDDYTERCRSCHLQYDNEWKASA